MEQGSRSDDQGDRRGDGGRQTEVGSRESGVRRRWGDGGRESGVRSQAAVSGQPIVGVHNEIVLQANRRILGQGGMMKGEGAQTRKRIGAATGVMTWSMVALVMAGCSTLLGSRVSPEEKAAYEAALERRVQGYVFDMSCDALLPMAEQLLWDEGYRDVDYDRGRMGLSTEWSKGEHAAPVQYAVYAHQAGTQRCAVQFMRRKDGGGQKEQRRDIGWELDLIEFIDEKEAARIRDQARREAEAVRK